MTNTMTNEINSVEDFILSFATPGKYVMPGMYPVYYIMADGEPMSFEAAYENRDWVIEAFMSDDPKDQWRVIGWEINWGGDDEEPLFCCHTHQKIESAYGD